MKGLLWVIFTSRIFPEHSQMTRSFRTYLYCISAVALAIPIATAGIVAFLPDPQLQSSPELRPGVQGLPESRDRLAVVVWILTALIAALIARRRLHDTTTDASSVVSTRFQRALVALVSFTMFAGLLWKLDREVTYNFDQVRLSEFLVASAFTFMVWSLRHVSRPIIGLLLVAGGAAAAVLYFPAYFQSPSTLLDGGHFRFTYDEILAPSAGNVPLFNYTAQYSNLLGMPIVPFAKAFPDKAATAVVVYFIVLQFITLAAPAYLARTTGQRKHLVPAVAIVTAFGALINSYFQVFPLRTVLPSLLLILTVICAQQSQHKFLWWGAVGLLAALSTINNPDFGGFATVAAVCSLAAGERSLAAHVRMAANVAWGFVAGCVVVALGFWATGHPIRFELLFVFQRAFGQAGLMNAPMANGGLPIVFVTLFAVGAVLGIYAFSREHVTRDRRLKAVATWLLFNSVWGLFASLYFSGRSYSSTAIGAFSVPMGLLLAGVLIYLAVDGAHLWQQIRSSGEIGMILPVLGFASLVVVVMAVLRSPDISTGMDRFLNRSTTYASEDVYIDQIFSDEAVALTDIGVLKAGGRGTGLLLQGSNALQLRTGMRSVLVSNHPWNAGGSVRISELQCEKMFASNKRFFIEENGEDVDYARFSVLVIPRCQTLFGPHLRTVYLSPSLRVIENTLASGK